MSDVGNTAAGAILEEGEARDWGTSDEDLQAYAGAAGGACGAAACAAVGQPELAPICGSVASWATEWVAGTLIEWCTSSAEAERARQRREDVRRLHNRIDQIGAWSVLNGQMLSERVDALVELHHHLWPDDPWEYDAPDIAPQQRGIYYAILLLAAHGMPTESVTRGGYVHLGLPSMDAEWERLRHEMSDEVLFDLLQAEAIETSERIGTAYDASVLELTARSAGDQSLSRLTHPTVRAVVQPGRRVNPFGETGVEPGPGRVRVPVSKRSWKAAFLRGVPVLVVTAIGCVIGARRARA